MSICVWRRSSDAIPRRSRLHRRRFMFRNARRQLLTLPTFVQFCIASFRNDSSSLNPTVNRFRRLTTGRRRLSSPKVLSAMVVESGNRPQGRFWSCRDPLRTKTISISPERFSPSRFVCLHGRCLQGRAPARMVRLCVARGRPKNYQITRLLTKTSIRKSSTFALPQSYPVIEVRKPLLLIELCWCREGELNPQDPKVGGF